MSNRTRSEWLLDWIVLPVLCFIVMSAALYFHAQPYQTFRFGEFNQLGRIDTRSGKAEILSGVSGKASWVRIQEARV